MDNTREYLSGGTRAAIAGLPPCRNCGNAVGPGEAYRTGNAQDGQQVVEHMTRLYFDECAIAVSNTLREMGFCIADTMPEGTPDTEWMAEAGKNGWAVITQDGAITRRRHEMQALIENKVKCFILPGRSRNSWDLVRGFVTMWGKIEAESLFDGPFVWRLNDESHAARWEQLYPEDRGYAPLDFSMTPIGHLLNLFADAVHMHDQGWFTHAFIDGLHENILRELVARVTGDRAIAMQKDPEWRKFGETRYTGEENSYELDEPMDLGELRHLVVSGTPEGQDGSNYPWIIPAHKAARYLVDGDGNDENFFRFIGRPTGFHRSGFGLHR